MQASRARGPLAVEPSGIEWAWVNTEQGLASAEHCADAVSMPFIRGSVPTRSSECGRRGPRSPGEWIRSWFR